MMAATARPLSRRMFPVADTVVRLFGFAWCDPPCPRRRNKRDSVSTPVGALSRAATTRTHVATSKTNNHQSRMVVVYTHFVRALHARGYAMSSYAEVNLNNVLNTACSGRIVVAARQSCLGFSDGTIAKVVRT
jgi:hypothetical protein